ncbi:glycerophosphodiester phosphodiesterase family protein [Citricoccus sp. SGAir0253]|uniref:glycerophosphodiester phosphodiesterase family protein n=1 Tax=Citricoccus sp. SGAir0253 TaxID=2567881 RepID=UPI00143D4C41|nr:glycerophosphodiester phosphodiesterase family protein [Citricoccus sp. SGAir0253]
MAFRARRPVTTLLAAAVVTAGLAAPTAALAAPSYPDIPGQDRPKTIEQIQDELTDLGPDAEPLIAAHRAQWHEYPENSLPAIEEAIQDGAEIIELDVELTADGVPVLMHDTTVDRTTKATGAVGDYTLAEIKDLRLLDHMGRDDNAVETQYQIPTLAEAMELVKGRAMVNIDKGWPEREEVAAVLEQTGTADHALIKGAPSVDAAVEFMTEYPDIEYIHLVNDDNWQSVGDFPAEHQPIAYEVVFNTDDDAQADPAFLEDLGRKGRIWVNTMWDSLAAGNTDEASIRSVEDLGWQNLVENYSASILQTDTIEAMDFWRDGGDMARYQRLPGVNTVRIEAEDVTEGEPGVDFWDVDANRCAATSPGLAFIDVCDGSTLNHTRGGLALAHIEGGEFLTYEFEIAKPGNYDVVTRAGTQYVDGGTLEMTWDGEDTMTHTVPQTSHLGAFFRSEAGTRWFDKGTHTLKVAFPEEARQDLNLDYLQLDYVGR